MVSGLPKGTTSDKLKIIFPAAKSIDVPKQSNK